MSCEPFGEAMRRREFIALIGASVAWPFAAMGQQAPPTYHLGLVSPVPCKATPSTSPLTLAFQDELRHLGFIKDQNLTIACRDFGPNIDLSSQYAAELEPISKSPEEDDEASELDKAEEVLGVIPPAHKYAALPLDPGEEAFYQPPSSVSSVSSTVLGRGLAAV